MGEMGGGSGAAMSSTLSVKVGDSEDGREAKTTKFWA